MGSACSSFFAVAAEVAVVAAVAVADSTDHEATGFDNILEEMPRSEDLGCCKSAEDFAVEPFEDWAAAFE